MDKHFLLEVVLWLILASTAIAVLFKRSLLSCLALVTVFSLTTAALFLSMEAPDVAITEAAIGASISTMFMLAAIRATGSTVEGKKRKLIPAIICTLLLFAAMVSFIHELPDYGDANSPVNQGVGKYYIDNAKTETGIPAVVTAVLGSYRGYDTMGETYVILCAGIAVLLILPNMRRRKPAKEAK